MNRRPFLESLFVACCVKVTACDYEVAHCGCVARSRASESRDKIAGVTCHLRRCWTVPASVPASRHVLDNPLLQASQVHHLTSYKLHCTNHRDGLYIDLRTHLVTHLVWPHR